MEGVVLAVGSVALAIAANFLRSHKGTTWLLSIAFVLIVGSLVVASYFPWVVTGTVGERPLTLYRTQNVAYCIAAAAVITAAAAVVPVKPYVRIAVVSIIIFFLSLEGSAIT